VGVAGSGERVAGPGGWVGGFAGEGEGEEVSEAGVAEGVGSIRRWGPVMGSRQAVQVGVVGCDGGGIEVGLVMDLISVSFVDELPMGEDVLGD
jgi:hypothetical protein